MTIHRAILEALAWSAIVGVVIWAVLYVIVHHTGEAVRLQ